ncbi:MAG: hypothetical protein SPL89_02500 [Clostridia bacterium]|nr:hypothetical protein [Clostridia bacterium]
MKRFLAAILSLTLILSALCAVGVSAEETSTRKGDVIVFYDDFENYDTSAGSINLPYNSWNGTHNEAGDGNGKLLNYEICEEDGNKAIKAGNWVGSEALRRYLASYEANPADSNAACNTFNNKVYIRFRRSAAFAAIAGTDYTVNYDFLYKESTGNISSNSFLGIFNCSVGMKLSESETKFSTEKYPTSTTAKNADTGWYTATQPINIYAYADGSTSQNIQLSPQMPNWGGYVYNVVKGVLDSDTKYSDLKSTDTTSDTYKAAAAEIQAKLDKNDYTVYLDNVKVTQKADIYQDTVTISGGEAVVKANTDARGDRVISSGDTVETNDLYDTVYTITPSNGAVSRVKYNGKIIGFELDGNNAKVVLRTKDTKSSNIRTDGALEITIAENSEYVSNTYFTDLKGGTAVNAGEDNETAVTPSLTSADGKVMFTSFNANTGNKADPDNGTFYWAGTGKGGGRLNIRFNDFYTAAGRFYFWKVYYTGSASFQYTQWSNPSSLNYFKPGETSGKYVNGQQNGLGGTVGNNSTEKYIYNDNDDTKWQLYNYQDAYFGYFGTNGATTESTYAYSVAGQIEPIGGSGTFTGFGCTEVALMHNISFEGEGTLGVKAASLNNFDNNKCNATLTNGQSAKVEDLMKADFTVTAPENKVIEAIRYVTYGGETEVGTELIGKQSGSFSIQPVEASGTIKVIYKENTPVQPKVEYSGSNVEHNKAYTVNGEAKISENSIIMYGTVTGEFDAYGFILSQFGADNVKTGEVTLAAETKSADGKFAVRVVGDGITVGKYSAAPYSLINDATGKGTETDITVTEN